MSKKGLSFEEKRKRLEHVFHESSDFFQLKELEKIAPKKGIVAQSVKDVLQSLVDDGLVVTDKIATSNYFWSYPSTATQIKRNKLETLRQQIKEEKEKIAQQQEAIALAQNDREESDERRALLNTLQEAENTRRSLMMELQKYKENDPETFRAKEQAIQVAKEAANRWTENIWTIQSYCVNKFGMDRRDFDKTFGIDDSFDTIP